MNRNYNNEACFNGGIQSYVGSNGIEFVGVMKVAYVNGMPKFQFTTLESVEIGKPAYLMLKDGRIAKTSPVLEWSTYGSIRLETKNHHYYALRLSNSL